MSQSLSDPDDRTLDAQSEQQLRDALARTGASAGQVDAALAVASDALTALLDMDEPEFIAPAFSCDEQVDLENNMVVAMFRDEDDCVGFNVGRADDDRDLGGLASLFFGCGQARATALSLARVSGPEPDWDHEEPLITAQTEDPLAALEDDHARARVVLEAFGLAHVLAPVAA